ncbi:hypothetical protein HPB52_003064 [Rhipicephalus sanguineus]|uniref:Ran gtpase-activating protein n=1 Tax=Rhipicephalus sanguineus TaxID=34632 RepID=A0A9D4PQX0_RHISA|nr:hypothetical protein HPB52_003064 [Rhipicephalus sanguineus]
MFRSSQDANTRFQQVNAILANKGADFMAPCGKQNFQDCDLLKHMGAWNDVLAAIQVRIEVVQTREIAVCFPVKMSDQRETRARVERAVVLLHKIFVKHTCVTTIALDDLGLFCNPEWFTLLCHGISKCRRLKTLRVNADMDEASYYRQLLTGCMSLEHIEELCFEKFRDSENAGNMVILAAVIEGNTKLVQFKVDGFTAVTRNTSTLLRALQQCQRLSHLSLNVTCFGENEATLFLNMLKGKNALKSLRLEGTEWHDYITVSGIASALSNSTTLVNLELLGFRLHSVDVRALAMNLVHVQTMQTLIVDQCMPSFSLTDGHMHAGAHDTRAHVSSRIAPYIYIIKQFTGLRCFAFDLLRFSSGDQRAFLEVLATTDSPTRVFVPVRTRGYPSELSRIAMETGTASRIHLSRVCMDEIDLTNLPTGSRVGDVVLEVQHGTWDNEIPNVNACLAGMRTFDHVENFTLEMRGSIMALSTAKPLASYLEDTKCLKGVTLNFSASEGSSMLLLRALSRNSSITSLGVERWCSRRRSAKVLADVVSSSKMIHTLTYNEGSMAPAKTFFSRLSESIAGNFTIVSVNTFERRENAKNWALIQNVATRNATLLERAARFVARLSLQKSDAEAFEAVASSPLLPLRVQTLAAVDEREAVKMVRRAVWSLRDLDVFMTIIGVVNESVVCEKSSDGRARLDTLPADCWLAIRRYLSVVDVVSAGPNGC